MSWRSARHGLGWLGVLLIVAVVRQAAPLQGAADSPVVAAAKAGDRAGVRKAITTGANVNTPGTDGSTALLWAVYNSDVELTRALLAAGAKPEVANRYGVTPLLQAARTGDTAIIEALLKAGANAKAAIGNLESPLMAASRTGRVDAVRLLLAKGADVNEADAANSETGLMWAAAEGHADVVQALLEAGAKPNLQAHVNEIADRRHADHPTGGFTALMWAARNGHVDVVQALAKGGADLNVTNGDKATAAIIAIANDRLDMASMLLDLGADANDGGLYFAVDAHDGTTDMLQKDGGLLRWDHPNKLTTVDLINKYIAKGADVNKVFQGQLHSYSMANPDNHNASPFYRAAVASDVEVLKILIPKGANLKFMPTAPAGGRGGAAGRSALMAASTGGRGATFGGGPGYGRQGPPIWREAGSRKPVDAVKLLVEAGADVNMQLDDDGMTALHQAAQRNDLDMIRALAPKADFELYNWAGQRALDIAEENYETSKKQVGPDAATIAAMVAGTAPPEKKDPKETVGLLRQLMKLPAYQDAPAPAAATTTAAAQGGR